MHTYWRHEYKALLPESFLHTLTTQVSTHPFLFTQKYPDRYVNSIYFDTPEFSHYEDHVNGALSRSKYRIRWYHTLFGKVQNPQLEIKHKEGACTHKKHYPLSSFAFYTGITGKQIQHILPHPIQFLYPTVLTRYKRSYFESTNYPCRVTIDTDITYYPLHPHFLQKQTKMLLYSS
jgi:SPX domain protein involved in polyphosphate accumulation